MTRDELLSDDGFTEFADNFVSFARACGYTGDDEEIIVAAALPMFDAAQIPVDEKTRAKAKKFTDAIGFDYVPFAQNPAAQ